jgi:hypothetical protein
MNLQSECGRSFRQQQRSQIIRMLNGSFGKDSLFWSQTPDQLNFLFLDRDFTAQKPSLAMEFWPHYNRMIAAIPGNVAREKRRHRLLYLARMWPESAVDMFVEAYRQCSDSSFAFDLPDTIPTEARARILAAAEEQKQQLLSTLKPTPRILNSDDVYNTARNSTFHLRWDVDVQPSQRSAILFAEVLELPSGESEVKRRVERLNHDRSMNAHVEVLARHDNPKLRVLAMPPIRRHPIPRRTSLLAALVKDEDPTVREQAIKVQSELDRLSTDPLPVRRIPSAAP